MGGSSFVECPFCLVDVGRGAKKNRFQQFSGDFPLNSNKQKCKIFPNNNHVLFGALKGDQKEHHHVGGFSGKKAHPNLG